MDDLISRQDAIDAVSGLYIHELSDGEYLVDAKTEDTLIGKFQTIDVLANVPSAQQWIPCSERLPESKSERIILLYDNGLISGGKYLGDRTFDIDFRDNDKKTKVAAWMPLPKPYKEGES